ncbi:hypothetical protein PFISCL1PPCAC_28741, partial [Pristionchus fissidentatus]
IDHGWLESVERRVEYIQIIVGGSALLTQKVSADDRAEDGVHAVQQLVGGREGTVSELVCHKERRLQILPAHRHDLV